MAFEPAVFNQVCESTGGFHEGCRLELRSGWLSTFLGRVGPGSRQVSVHIFRGVTDGAERELQLRVTALLGTALPLGLGLLDPAVFSAALTAEPTSPVSWRSFSAVPTPRISVPRHNRRLSCRHLVTPPYGSSFPWRR